MNDEAIRGRIALVTQTKPTLTPDEAIACGLLTLYGGGYLPRPLENDVATICKALDLAGFKIVPIGGLDRGTREELAARRPSLQFDFAHGDHCYTATVGVRPDGTLAEIFLNTGKEGSLMQTLAADSAILASLLLQYGVPFDAIVAALTRNPNGAASGPIGHLLDQLAREAGIERASHG